MRMESRTGIAESVVGMDLEGVASGDDYWRWSG
jgi:hypothetical protein